MTTIFNVHITFTKAREPPTLYTTVLLCSKISRISNIWQRIIISTAQSTLGEAQMVQDSSNKILRLKFSEKCLNICPPSTFFGKNYFTFSIFREMFEHLPSLHNVCQNPLNCDTASSKMSLWFNICGDDQNVCQLPLNHLNFLWNGFVVSFFAGASKTLQVLQMLKPEILKILHLKHSCIQKW